MMGDFILSRWLTSFLNQNLSLTRGPRLDWLKKDQNPNKIETHLDDKENPQQVDQKENLADGKEGPSNRYLGDQLMVIMNNAADANHDNGDGDIDGSSDSNIDGNGDSDGDGHRQDR